MGERKKRILMLNYEFPPLGGGAGNATYYMLKEFSKKKDIEIDLVTSSINKFKIEDFSDNVRIHFLDIKKKGSLHYQSNLNLLIYSYKAYFYSKKLLKENKYDLCHAFFGIPCGYIAMKLKIPYIVSLRGSDVPFYSEKYEKLDRYVFQHLSKLIWKGAKDVIANSQGLRDLAYETYGKREIGVIYNGVDIEVFKPKEKGKGFKIVSTSRLTERKGLNYLIEAFSEFQKGKKNVKLIFYGDGDKRDELERMVEELDIQKKVEFLGEVSREDIARDISECHVFVLPSKNEGMSNSLLEAMASGLAIMATDVGGTKELVDSKNGIVIKKEDSESIRMGLEKLYNDREYLKSMAEDSRKKAENMSWDNVANKYVKLYKEINA